jgi:REP element-mobilizing transposase RayT
MVLPISLQKAKTFSFWGLIRILLEFAKWYSKQSFWSGSYYVASSGGAPIQKLKNYIKSQNSPKS